MGAINPYSQTQLHPLLAVNIFVLHFPRLPFHWGFVRQNVYLLLFLPFSPHGQHPGL